MKPNKPWRVNSAKRGRLAQGDTVTQSGNNVGNFCVITIIQRCRVPKPPVSVCVLVHVMLDQRRFWSCTFLPLLTPTKRKKRTLNVYILDASLSSSGSSSFTYSEQYNYTSNVPLLACLFLSAVLLQVNQCTISSPSVYQNVHFARLLSFIAAWIWIFPDEPVQDCTQCFSSLSGGMWEQMMTVWYISLRDAFGGKIKNKKPDKPTADCSICPSLSEARIKEIISIL